MSWGRDMVSTMFLDMNVVPGSKVHSAFYFQIWCMSWWNRILN